MQPKHHGRQSQLGRQTAFRATTATVRPDGYVCQKRPLAGGQSVTQRNYLLRLLSVPKTGGFGTPAQLTLQNGPSRFSNGLAGRRLAPGLQRFFPVRALAWQGQLG